MKCGLCLPSCPTYRLYADESESPRGRIALAEALLRGTIKPDPGLRKHLGNCLMCRRCEAVCPSKVDFTRLMDAARERLGDSDWTTRALQHTEWLPAAGALARHLPGTAGRLARSLSSPVPTPQPGVYAADRPARGRVGLLLGCVTRFNQGGALAASIFLLNRLGYVVSVPAGQTCCGALAQHSGNPRLAQQQAGQNRKAFAGVDALVSVASGCSAHLHTYPAPVRGLDICEFLDTVDDWSGIEFAPPRASHLLHQPCSVSNALRAEGAVVRLLQRLPGEEPPLLGSSGDCCGAAGDHLLRKRGQATAIREPLLQQLIERRPQVLLTSNVGCAMHLAEGARQALPDLLVMHPVEWLVQHLRSAPSARIGQNIQEQP